MSLSSLPSDVLFHIFTLFDNLSDIHATASVCRPLHQAFWDQRARVLQHVFRNQILKSHADYLAKPYPDSSLGRSRYMRLCRPLCTLTPGVLLESINPIMTRYEETRLPDRLVLRSTAWATFIGFKSPEWVFTSLGKKLISLCRTLGREDLALSYAAELWKYISTRQTFEYRIVGNKLASDKYANSFARTLAGRYYHDLKRPEDAARTILEMYSMDMRDHDYQLFSHILKYTQDMIDPSEVLSFFRGRAATEREALIDKGTFKGDLHWTFCLNLLLSGLGKVQEAICVFNNTYILYSDERLDSAPLEGLSRRLIRSLRDKKYYDEAFTIHQQILILLSSMHRTTSSRYMAWAKQYISELYAAGRLADALAVEEQCWNRIRERLTVRRENSSVFAGRGAAWALSRSYQRRGQPEQAMRVRWEYENLARACIKPWSHVTWPGEDREQNSIGMDTYQESNERHLLREAAYCSSIQV